MNSFKSFQEACEVIKSLPYKRNANKSDIYCVLKDKGGTCSTKHAFLKHYADEKGIKDVKLMLGIFRMNAQNTQKIASVLEKYGLKEMPEAHNYLKVNGKIKDYTRRNSKPEDFVDELIEEIEISPLQITDFKANYHKKFMDNYLENHPEITFSAEQFWAIREECIEAFHEN